MPNLSVIQPGLQTTVQDLGREIHQIDGFPVSGAWISHPTGLLTY